ncbi:putative transferase CAF17 homolog, mitochondrial [Anopheles bellator]|uniref:putative transferase CAF17 homolog, mitochondrial n=1 Tax=Anopheles bellator TaxID=139047 RepID=UPI002648F7F5|nr:putative transferase CAF17 homolog, mitochondrial [Anopheles bellator]
MLLRRWTLATGTPHALATLTGFKLLPHRTLSSSPTQPEGPSKPFALEPLRDRSFVRVHGTDSVSFLQGLMTNDMRHFEHSRSLYAMFLRVNGRVFCDALIFRHPAAPAPATDFLLECDREVAPRLEKHLKLYRLRKKVTVLAEETYQPWVAFVPDSDEQRVVTLDGDITTGDRPDEDRVNLYKDPRLPRLGYRALIRDDTQAASMDRLLELVPGVIATDPQYTPFRYSLGVGEGETNLPDGKCFPLECNCDFLHGVSFHKGCYIGQELTARTYHTGVIRKRLMPVQFTDGLQALEGIPPEVLREAEIKNEDGAVVGKLRGYIAGHGMALLRVEKVLTGTTLALTVPGIPATIPCRTKKPFWWPNELNARS